MKKLLTIIMIVTVLFTVACMDGSDVKNPDKEELMKYLPDNAVVLEDIGNGWHTVRIGEMIYLAVIQSTYGFYDNVHLVFYKKAGE